MQFQGLLAVLVTPFTANGRVDGESLDRLVDFYLYRGARGLVVLSVMGEGPALTGRERIGVVRRVARRVSARVPVIAGVNEGTPAAGAMARRLVDQGATALLVCTPSAQRSQYDEIAAHYRHLAVVGGVPLVMLDHPELVGELPIPFIERVTSQVAHVRAIKVEAAPTHEKIAGLRSVLGDRLSPLGASGGLHCLAELEAGAVGLMTGYAYPEQLVEIMARFRAGDRDGAQAEYERWYPDLTQEQRYGLAFRKDVLRKRGIISSSMLRPRLAPAAGSLRAWGRPRVSTPAAMV
ncbi:MAG: dihydrodipicolinate synthase family protein [Myxococcota bacterium]